MKTRDGVWARGVGGAARAVRKPDIWRQQFVSVLRNRHHAGGPANTTHPAIHHVF
ncbi:hypothetical protein M0L20_10405 [Spirosoma sp. RP8]|uniref:Uncharacterized protein n=1 Tax=Spirosoma liriopis TaxID=2937440 RepID=A0ABT0HKY6_9BACT|nr:hypothetical protein [Spirosoma liriopis]MCK8492260.1 hypothetical protein [Spirosoma liriopis]